MSEKPETAGDVDRYCDNCEMVVYDIPISGPTGSGYCNPNYCPKCGKPVHTDWEECEKCGDVIDFKKVSGYAKTNNDKRFWHSDCAPQVMVVDGEDND